MGACVFLGVVLGLGRSFPCFYSIFGERAFTKNWICRQGRGDHACFHADGVMNYFFRREIGLTALKISMRLLNVWFRSRYRVVVFQKSTAAPAAPIAKEAKQMLSTRLDGVWEGIDYFVDAGGDVSPSDEIRRSNPPATFSPDSGFHHTDSRSGRPCGNFRDHSGNARPGCWRSDASKSVNTTAGGSRGRRRMEIQMRWPVTVRAKHEASRAISRNVEFTHPTPAREAV